MAHIVDPVWNDFDSVRHSIPRHTVDRLKQILVGLNETCSTHLSKAGNKQAIIDRITSTLDGFRTTRATDKWVKAKAIVQNVRYPGVYGASTSGPILSLSAPPPPPTYTTANSIKTPSFNTIPPIVTVGRYDPYAPPRKAAAPAPSPSSTATAASSKSGVRFKESPFFHVNQAVSGMIECPESTSATDRRSQVFSFSLTSEQMTKLKSASPKYQLRLFCTSSTFYSPTHSSFRPSNAPCLVEFPPTCEVRVNNVQISANLKGLKKKPGTAPPPDLGKYLRPTSTASNRVEMIYVNSQQPTPHKKFYLMVQLVEVVAVESLVQNLVEKGFKSSHEIRSEMVNALAIDDDIVAGSQKMSLKCPLSYMRVTTPCRSRKCPHSQCFDATSWFTVMEQTTTWLCPVCERILDPADLIVDGYFDEILKSSPDSVEDVIVEADGEWHTSDNKYGSATWKAAHPPAAKPAAVAKPVTKSPPKADPNGKRKAIESIVVLDSDDEDEGLVKRELSASFASSSSGNQSGRETTSKSQPDVIDLTLDSDDEEPPPPPPRAKRTASEAGIALSPTENIWKKGRVEAIGSAARLSPGTDFARTASVGSLTSSRTLPPLATAVYSLSRQGGSSSSPSSGFRWA